MGLGFVGLTTALGFAEKGHKVVGFEINEELFKSLENTFIPFHEPSLEEMLKKHLGKKFQLQKNLSETIQNSDIIFLCVGTPSDDTGKCNLSQLYSAIDSILAHKPTIGTTLVIKSTVPPSTALKDVKTYIESKGVIIGKDLGLASNPEFLREGKAWEDFIVPDRIVIGTEDRISQETMAKAYEVFNAPIDFVSLNTAEFIKYLSNTMLSTMISFSNEMSMIAKTIGNIDISKAFKNIHMDKRWFGLPAPMQDYVYPGCGFGGYCLEKDTQAMYAKAGEYGYDAKLLGNVLDINKMVKSFLCKELFKDAKPDQSIGILGLSFKPNSDDVRNTPSHKIIEELQKSGYKNIVGFDPIATENFKNSYKHDISYAQSLEEAVSQSDHLVIVTMWDQFKNLEVPESKKIHNFRYQ